MMGQMAAGMGVRGASSGSLLGGPVTLESRVALQTAACDELPEPAAGDGRAAKTRARACRSSSVTPAPPGPVSAACAASWLARNCATLSGAGPFITTKWPNHF